MIFSNVFCDILLPRRFNPFKRSPFLKSRDRASELRLLGIVVGFGFWQRASDFRFFFIEEKREKEREGGGGS